MKVLSLLAIASLS